MIVESFNGSEIASIKSIMGLARASIKSINGVTTGIGFRTERTVAGDAAARTITLPLVEARAEGALAYNFIVSWGDGTPNSVVTSFDDVNRIHTYASDGVYEVEIVGVCEGWSFNNSGDKLKITRVISFGNTAVFDGFKYLKGGFYGCTNLTSLGTDPIPASGTGILTDGFDSTFRNCSSLVYVQAALFSEHTLVTNFYAVLYGCTSLTTPPDFSANTLVTTFRDALRACTSLTTPPDFSANTLVTNFQNALQGCIKLQQDANMFYGAGEQSTRFLDQAVNFQQCFDRDSFTGIQGTAPDLWNCDFGKVITLDVSPGTDWDPDDVITGQTSGATCVVRSKVDATHYKVYKHLGTFTLDEIIGVTGVPAKLADQGAAHPTTAGGPIITDCWDGAGNSVVSLDNYNDIPADWT